MFDIIRLQPSKKGARQGARETTIGELAPMPLTEITCKNAKPKEKAYKLSDSGGLYLEVMPNGSKFWRIKYYYLKKEKRLSLGRYPLVSLAEAREGRDKAKKQIMGNIDPSTAKQNNIRNAILSAEQTFEAIAREWHDKKRDSWKPTHGRNILHRLEADIFPEIGSRPIAEISASELLHVIKKIEDRGALEVARKTLRMCGQVFKYAIVTDRRPDNSNPATALPVALKSYKKGHFAALETKAIPKFLKTLERNDARLFPQTIRAMKLLMLTFVRTSELIQARVQTYKSERVPNSIDL